MNTWNAIELGELLDNDLKPNVRAIDRQGLYPERFLRELGQRGYYGQGEPCSPAATLELIEQISSVCASTAFCVWCHTNAIHLIRSGDNDALKRQLLPSLEDGSRLGGTGLSNAMKYYAGLEPLRLKAERVADGYVLNGVLPYVSNLGPDHWFGAVASVSDERRIMVMVPCDAPGLTLELREDFLGLNGTSTFACKFADVIVPDQWLIAEQADTFVQSIRTFLVGNQIGLAFGIIRESIAAMNHQSDKQQEANRWLRTQPDALERRLEVLRRDVYAIWEQDGDIWPELVRLRLTGAYLAIEAAQTELFHTGSAGYLRDSSVSRRLREAYFISVLTPAIKHLEKMSRSAR